MALAREGASEPFDADTLSGTGGRWPTRPRSARAIGIITLLAAAYFVAGKLGLALAFVHPSATPVWAPSGIALAATLVFGYQVWPSIVVGAFLVNQVTEGSVLTSALIAVGNTLEPLLGAYLVNRFARGRDALDRIDDVFRFAGMAGALSPLVSATVGGMTLVAAGYAHPADLGPIWFTWWLGDAAGVLIVAPVLVLWTRDPPLSWKSRPRWEAIALLVLLAILGGSIFGPLPPTAAPPYPVEFLTLPPLIWAAFAIDQRNTATAAAFLSGIALLGTVRGYGPFVRVDLNESLLLLQAYMGCTALTSMALAAAVAERQRAAQALVRVSAQAVAAEEETRREIAELLHGRVQSRLLLAWERLGQSERLLDTSPAESRALLNHARQTIDEVREREIRRASYRLHPPFLREGLRPAVDELAELFRGELTVTVETGPAFSAWDTTIRNHIPESLRLASYRIIEEALANAVRHGRASSVQISLDVHLERDLAIIVQDDGCGFDPTTTRYGLGLGSIEARVHQAGGSWDISSAQGTGTTVHVRLPLHLATDARGVTPEFGLPLSRAPNPETVGPRAAGFGAGTRGLHAPGD
ncbi:MAG TPA: MASE1 domain-containing protein [Chloroflexota bacterium]|nr:MASE1 domain-containing protein [Chloroflexota bacterium]